MEEKNGGDRRVIRRKSADEKSEHSSTGTKNTGTRKRISKSSVDEHPSGDRQKSAYSTKFNSDNKEPRKRENNEQDDRTVRSAKRRIGLKKKSDTGYVPKKHAGNDSAKEGKKIIRKKSSESGEKKDFPRKNNDEKPRYEKRSEGFREKRNEDTNKGSEKRIIRKKSTSDSDFGRKKSEGRGGRPSDRPDGKKLFRKKSDKDTFNPEKKTSKPNYNESDFNQDNTFVPKSPYSKKKQLEFNKANPDAADSTRLNKFISNAGICSRREADNYITAGVVKINDKIITELGTKVMPGDVVKFNDSIIKSELKVYLLLNKPKDYITTTDDPHAKNTVMDLIEDACRERIYPVGRLDRNTTGLLLFTNDGEIAKKLMHPKYNKKKIYHVHLDRNFVVSDISKMLEGYETPEGFIQADEVSFVDEADRTQVGIELHTGQNHAVKHLFEVLGYRVEKLDRVYFAGLTKKNLPRGEWRFLTDKEIGMLRMGAYV